MEVREAIVWDGSRRVAALAPSTSSTAPVEAVTVRLLSNTMLRRDTARALVAALTDAEVPVLDVHDELLRAEARTAGWTGALRSPLRAPSAPPVLPAADGATAEETAAAVQALLPGVQVLRRGLRRRSLSLRATAAGGVRLTAKVTDRPDVIPELLAAALDTAVAIRRRFGRIASGVHTISIDDGAGSYDDHSTLGSAQSGTGTFFLDTSLACADAIDEHRRRMSGRRGASAEVPPPWFTIDGVVAHEYWHNLDPAVVATPSVYVEMNRALGAELDVETFEHALRGGERSAPTDWQRAFRRIVDEVSPYATSTMREATAELFKLWWCRDPAQVPSGLVACFGELLDRFYPPTA